MSNQIISYQELIKQEYKKCLASPVYFMKKYVKIQHPIRGTIFFGLYPFQEETLQAFADFNFNIILKSRQMGISTLVAAYSLWMMIFNKDKNILIISLKQEVAKEIITKVRFANDNLPPWLKVKCEEDNRLSLKLANGSQIRATSTTKKSGVSLALSLLIIDEAALIEDAEELWTSAQPTLSCLDKSHLILTENGLIRLESLITNTTKIGFNDLNLNVHNGDTIINANSFYMSAKSDLFEITLKSGGKLIATKNHPLMTKSGWKCVDELQEKKDELICKYNQQLFGNNIDFSQFKPNIRKDSKIYKLTDQEVCYLAGLWTAEGYFVKCGIGITNTDDEITNWLEKIGFKYCDNRHYQLNSVWMLELLKWIGCEGIAHTKRVPDKILSGSKENQIQYLKGLFDGDGCSLGKKGVKLTSVSYELLSNVRAMLLNMGINSYIRDVVLKATKSTVIKDKAKVFNGYELYIGGFDAHLFYSTIGFNIKRKQIGWQKLPRKSIKRIYPDKTLIKNLILESGMSIREFSKKHKCCYDRYLWYGGKGLSISSVETLLNTFNGLNISENYKLLKQQYNKDISEFYDEVVSIKYLKNDFSYDLKVNSSERFICEGYINHNTGGRAIILSTPRGVGNWFHRMWQGAEENNDGKIGKNGFHPIKLPWNLHPERDEEWRRIEGEKIGSPKKAGQEFDCDFLASGDNVVELIIVDWYKKNRQRDPVEVRGADHGLWIWQYPDYSRAYIVSADVARGDSSDFSACHVIDAMSLDQCAEYKGSLETKDFGNFLVALATEYNNALLIIERENVGWAAIQSAIDRNYANLFYSSTELKYIDVQRQLRSRYDSDEKKLVPGFSTNIKTRPLVISHLEQYCREEFKEGRGVKIYSKRTLAELDTFVWKNGKAIAMEGFNDDLVMALGIGLWVRDTALRLRQEGIDLTKATLAHSDMKKSEIQPFYKSRVAELGHKSWQMQTGRRGFGHHGDEDIRWLLG